MIIYKGNKLLKEYAGIKIINDINNSKINNELYYKILNYNVYNNTLYVREIKSNGLELLEILKTCKSRIKYNLDDIKEDCFYEYNINFTGRNKQDLPTYYFNLKEIEVIA